MPPLLLSLVFFLLKIEDLLRPGIVSCFISISRFSTLDDRPFVLSRNLLTNDWDILIVTFLLLLLLLLLILPSPSSPPPPLHAAVRPSAHLLRNVDD